MGCLVQGDLFPDEPLLLPGHDSAEFLRAELRPYPLHLLGDENERVVGVHIVGHHEATRVCDLHPHLVTHQERDVIEKTKVKAPIGRWPESQEEFDLLMELIDEELRSAEVPTHTRPFHALRLAGKRLGKDMNLTARGESTREGCYSDDDFVLRVHQWYQERYADRLSVKLSPGRFAIRLYGDVWECVLPRAFGSVEYTYSRSATPRQGTRSERGPIRCNMLDCVTDLTDQIRFRLTDDELEDLFLQFKAGVRAFEGLERLIGHSLAKAARSDLELCAADLLGAHHYGQAKWSALQATEKVMKLALATIGVGYDHHHNLSKLAGAMQAAGCSPLDPDLISRVQCPAGVRYGTVASSRDDALEAQAAALELCATVTEELIARLGKSGS